MMDQQLLQREFPLDTGLAYLNHAAVAPWPARTTEALSAFARENSTRGAEHYRKWSGKEISLREQLRWLVNAPSVEDIALLKNTSEAISVVAAGIDWQEGDTVVSTDEEFPSNRIPWEAQRDRGVIFKPVPVQVQDPERALMAACDESTRVLSISSVQYGSGLKLDLEKLGSFCRENNILYCVDAIQSIGAHRFDVQAMQADFAMADAHKWMLGPEGIALFYCREAVRDRLRIHQYGWHMVQHAGDYDRRGWDIAASAKRFECGSPNMLGTFALSASLSLFQEVGLEAVEKAILEKSSILLDRLQALPGIVISTRPEIERRAGIVHFRLPDRDHAALHREMMKQRVICACRHHGLRFSPHFYTPEERLHRAVDTLSSLL